MKLNISDWEIYLIVGGVWGLWHLPYYLVFLPEADINTVLSVSRAVFAMIAVLTMICWTVMFVELYRITESLWPCVTLHMVEDSFVNPLVLSGFISIAANKEILVSPILGVLNSLLYVAIGLWMRAYRIRQNQVILDRRSLPV